MAIYLAIEALLLVAIYAKRNRNLLYYALLSIMILVAGFRADTIGADMVNYIPTYQDYQTATWGQVLRDPNFSFAIYCKILTLFGLDIRGFLIANAILFSVLLTIALNVNKCDKLLALAIFYMLGLYTQSFCIIRQSFANVVFMIAYAYIDKGHIHLTIPLCNRDTGEVVRHSITISLRFLLLMVVAIGFHTATVFLLVIPCFLWIYPRKKEIEPQKFLRVGIAFLVLAFGVFQLLYTVVLSFMPHKYSDLYSDFNQSLFANAKTAGLLFVLYMVFYVAYKMHYERLSTEENLQMGSTITLAITLVSMSIIHSTLGRMNLFTECLMAMMMSKLLQNDYRNRKSIGSLFIAFYAVYFVLYLFRDSIGVVPYKFGL